MIRNSLIGLFLIFSIIICEGEATSPIPAPWAQKAQIQFTITDPSWIMATEHGFLVNVNEVIYNSNRITYIGNGVYIVECELILEPGGQK